MISASDPALTTRVSERLQSAVPHFAIWNRLLVAAEIASICATI